jgi:glycosyltransferase involved in cell wall biosynthesis
MLLGLPQKELNSTAESNKVSYKIIWLIDSLMPGGAEQLMPTILANFDPDIFEIRVCALQSRRGNPIANELSQLGIPVDVLPVQIRNMRNPLHFIRIYQYLKNISPALVHTQLEHSDTIGNLAAKLLGIPSVSTLHTIEQPKKKRLAFLRIRFKWWVLKHFCDRVITVSEKTREHHLEHGRLPGKKVSTLYNGVVLKRFQNVDPEILASKRQTLHIKPDNTIITTIAVLREPKGIQYMIQALPMMLETKPELTYLIVGDGVHHASLQDLVSDLHLNEHVIFAGHRSDIPDILALSDLFVLPSLGDALPTVLIEALAAEKPIVATQVGGIPEIIENNVNGLLVPPADSKGLAEACLKIIQDTELQKRFITAGFETAQQRFDVQIQINKLGNIYLDLIDQYGKLR